MVCEQNFCSFLIRNNLTKAEYHCSETGFMHNLLFSGWTRSDLALRPFQGERTNPVVREGQTRFRLRRGTGSRKTERTGISVSDVQQENAIRRTQSIFVEQVRG